MRPSGSVSGTRLAGLELVADVADQLGEHVLERQEPRGPAELVDDERLVRAPLAKLAQDAIGRHALVDAGDRPHQRLDARRGASVRRPPASARDPSCAGCRRCCRSSRGRPAAASNGLWTTMPMTSLSGVLMSSAAILRRGTISCLAWRRFSRSARCSRQVLVGLEQSAVAAFGDEQLDLLGRVDVAVGLMRRAEEAQEQQAGAVQPLDERPVDPRRRPPSGATV